MSNETAASISDHDQRVITLADFLVESELDLVCLHSSLELDDAVVIAKTVIAYLDDIPLNRNEN